MSWAAEEWKDGLSHKVLMKINDLETQLERTKKDRDTKQFQLESLEQVLDNQKRKTGSEKSEIIQLQREIKTLSESNAELERKGQNLSCDLLEKEKQLNDLKQKISSEYQSEIGKSLDTVDKTLYLEAQKRIQSLENELEELTQQLQPGTNSSYCQTPRKNSGEISRLNPFPTESHELQKTKQEIQSLQSLVNEFETKNKKLIQDMDCSRHNAEAVRAHLETKLKEREKELKLDLAQATEASNSAERKLQETQTKTQQEINYFQTEQNKTKGLVEKLEHEKTKLERDVQDLYQKLNKVDEVKKADDALLADMQKKCAFVEAEKETKNHQIACQEVNLKKMSDKVMQMEKETSDFKGLYDKSEAAYVTIKKEHEASQIRNCELESKYNSLNASIEYKTSQVHDLEKKNEKLSTDINEKDEELSKVITSLKSSQASTLEIEKEVDILKAELKSKNSLMEETEKKCNSLNEQLRGKQEEISKQARLCTKNQEKLQQTEESYNSKLKDIEEKYDGVIKKFNETKGSLENEQEMHCQTKSELENLKSSYSDLDLALDKSKNDLNDKNSLLGDTEKKCDKLVQDLQEYEMKLTASVSEKVSTMSNLLEMEKQIESLNSELVLKSLKVNEVEKRSDELEEILSKKNEEINSQIKENASILLNFHQMEESNKTIKNDLTERLENELKEIMDLKQCLKEEKDSHIIAKEENIHLKTLHSDLEFSFETVKGELNEKIAAAAGAEKHVESLTQAVTEKETAILDLKRQFEDLQNVTNEAESTWQAKHKEFTDKCIKLECEISEMRECSQNMNDELSQVEKDRDIWSEKASDLEGKLETLTSELNNKNTILSEVESECEQVKKDVKDKTDEISKLVSENNSNKNHLLEIEKTVDTLKSELDFKNLELEESAAVCEKLKEDMLRKEEEIDEQMKMNTINEERLQTLEKSNELRQKDMEQNLETALKELASSKECLEKEEALHLHSKEEIESLKQSNFVLESVNEELNEKVSSALDIEKKYENLSQTIKEKETTILDLKRQFEDLQNISNETECTWQVKYKEFTDRCAELQYEILEMRECSQNMKDELSQVEKDRDIWSEKASDLEGKLETLTSELNNKNTILSEVESECEQVKKDVKDKTDEISKLVSEKNSNKNHLLEIEKTVGNLKSELDSKNLELEESALVCEKLKDDMQMKEEEIIEQMKMNTINEERLQTLEQSNESRQNLDQNLETALNELASCKECLEKEETAHHQSKGEIERLKQLCSNLESAVESFKSELSEKVSSIADTNRKYENLSQVVTEKESTILELKGQFEHLQNITNEAECTWQVKYKEFTDRCRELECEISEMREKSENVKSELSQVEKDRDVFTEKASDLEGKLATLESELDNKSTTLIQMENECEQLKKGLRDKAEELCTFKCEENSSKDHLLELEKTVANLSSELQSKSLELEETAMVCDKLKGEVLKKEEEFNEQLKMNAINEEKLQNLEQNQEVRQKDLDQILETALNELTSCKECREKEEVAHHQSKGEIERLKQLCSDLESAVESFKSELSEKVSSIADAEKRCENLSQVVTEKEAKILDLDKELGDLQNVTNEAECIWEAKHTEFKNRCTKLELEISKIKEKFENVKGELSLVEKDRDVWSEKASDLEGKLETLESELDNKSTTLIQVENESEQLKKDLQCKAEELCKFESKENSSKDHLLELEKTVANLSSELQSKSLELEEASMVCDKLKEEVARKGEEFDEQLRMNCINEEKLHNLEEKDLEQNVEIAVKELGSVKERLEKEEALHHQSNEKIEHLRQLNWDLEITVDSVKADLNTKVSFVAELEKQCESLAQGEKEKENIITDLKKQLEDLQLHIDSSWQIKYDEIVDQYNKCNTDNLVLQDSLEKQNADLEAKSSLLIEAESRCEHLSKELLQMQEKSNELLSSLSEKQFSSELTTNLEKQLQMMQCEVKTKSVDFDDLESKWMILNKENLSKIEELCTTNSLLTEMRENCEKLSQQLQEKEYEIHASICDSKSKEAQIIEMQNEIKTLTSDLQSRNSTIEEMEKTNVDMKQEILLESEKLAIQSKINENNSEELQAMKEHEHLKVVESLEKLEILEKEINAAKTDLETEKQKSCLLEKEIEEMKTNNLELNSVITTQSSDLERKEAEISDCEKQCAEYKEQLCDLSAKCSLFEAELSSLKNELNDSHELGKTQLTTLEEMKVIVGDQKTSLEQNECKLSFLEQEMTEKEKALFQKEKEIEEIKAKLRCYDYKYDHEHEQSKLLLESRLQITQMDLDECQEQIEQLSSDKGCLKSSLESMTTERNLLNSQIPEMISQINDLKTCLDITKKKREILLQELFDEQGEMSVLKKLESENLAEMNSLKEDEEFELDLKDVSENELQKDKIEAGSVLEEGFRSVLYVKQEIINLINLLNRLETFIASQKYNYSSQIDCLKSSLETIATERDNLKASTNDFEQRNSDLIMNEKVNELHDCECELSDLNDTLSSKKFEEVEAQDEKSSDELKTLEEKENIVIKLSDMEKEGENTGSLNSSCILESERKTFFVESNSLVISQDVATQADKANCESYNESFSTQHFEVNEQLWKITVEKEALQKHLEETRNELESMKTKPAMESIVEREVSDLKEKFTQSQFDISELKCQLDCLENEKKTSFMEMAEIKQENVDLGMALQDIQDRNKALEECLEKLRMNASNLNEEAVKGSGELKDIQAQSEILQNMLDKLISQNAEENTKKAQITSKNVKKLSKSDSKLKLDLTNDLKNVTAEKEILMKKVSGLESELFEVKKSLEERTQVIDMDVDELKTETLPEVSNVAEIEMKSQFLQIQSEKLNMETERDHLIEKNKELVKEYQRVQDQNNALEQQIDEFRSATQGVSNDLIKLHDVIKDQNESLAKKKKEIIVKANEIETLRTDLAELFNKIQDKQKEIDALTEEVSKLKKELKESKSNAGTLEDVVESLNFDITALEEEKSSLISNVETAEEKIKELQNKLPLTNQCVEEMEELKNKNNQLNSKLLEMNELESLLRKDTQSTQEELKMKSIECEDLILQISEFKSEIAVSTDQVLLLQEKLLLTENKLSEIKSGEKERCEKVLNLQEERDKAHANIKIKDKEIENFMKAKEDLINQLESKHDELVLICDEKELLSQQFFEENEKCELLKSSNESLLCKLGEKEEQLSNMLKKDKDNCESLNNTKLSLKSQLEEKQEEISQLLESQNNTEKQLSELENCVSGLKKEVEGKDDEIRKLSSNLLEANDQLQQSKSSKDEINKIQKLQEDLLDKETKLKELKEEHKTTLSQLFEAAEKVEREKEELSLKLLEAQSLPVSQESGKEVLRKWEQRCKELDSSLTMERRKCQCLTEQINVLKSSEPVGSHKEIEELKSELIEVKKDRDCMRDERQQMFLKAKEYKDKVELLSCRIRVLTHMLKKQGKGSSQSSALDPKVVEKCSNQNSLPPVKTAETNLNKGLPETVCKSPSKVISSVHRSSPEKQCTVESSEVPNPVSSNSSPTIQRRVSSPLTKRLSPLSLRRKTSKVSNIPTTEISPGNEKHGVRFQTNSEAKDELIEGNIISPPKVATRMSTRKRCSTQGSQSMDSKDDSSHRIEKSSQINEQEESVTCVTRGNTLRKRECSESLNPVQEGKKPKVIYEDPMTWLKGPSKQSSSQQSQPVIRNSKTSTTSNLSGPATRSKARETSSKVLNPITNSPIKESQHRPKGFLRQTSKMSERKAQVVRGKDEAAQECNTQ